MTPLQAFVDGGLALSRCHLLRQRSRHENGESPTSAPLAPRGPFARPFDVRSLKGQARRDRGDGHARGMRGGGGGGRPAGDRRAAGLVSHRAARRRPGRAGRARPGDGDADLRRDARAVRKRDRAAGRIELRAGGDAPFPSRAGVAVAARSRRHPRCRSAATTTRKTRPIRSSTTPSISGPSRSNSWCSALDPYPRKPGVHFADMVVGEKDAPAPSAFAAPGPAQGSLVTPISSSRRHGRTEP